MERAALRNVFLGALAFGGGVSRLLDEPDRAWSLLPNSFGLPPAEVHDHCDHSPSSTIPLLRALLLHDLRLRAARHSPLRPDCPSFQGTPCPGKRQVEMGLIHRSILLYNLAKGGRSPC